ncbi:phosphonate metabolism protein/1,5-bisphosphokinase (PRPP-forming) PhnN [Pelagibius litoralis]|uniref:Ribose 1,5-bisphosphate phosphokinase PhnN n=1 Tax=Pelagibius litoralis TaxID=374515 RepID=A0A967C303_9PROT|nr:phosphonate metabolism protein/1,5-bisphosphokinase (PRPP-forming) PhnN [Pelagibius litoralis]NIA67465.1 phosphonate metabolism protein/1,5-bisphosphokinase (PRPP-forming) PhnN [Pelagibius litoralis]
MPADNPADTPGGHLILVVGPSGAGKDSVINAAKAELAGHPDYVFARRIITRPSDPDSEEHDTLAEAEFDRLCGEGAFFLHWGAHSLRYALPACLADQLAAGATVIANVSRAVIEEAQAKHRNTTVAFITASQAVLEQRLLARGREDRAAVRQRLARSAALPPGTSVVTIMNDGALADAVAQFLALLDGTTTH